MKHLAILSALLFAPCALAQEKSITYTAAARPLAEVVDALAKQSGLKLKVDTDIEDEPLILHLQEVPAKEAMDKIADVFASDWVDHKEYLRLERSEKKVAKLRDEWLRHRAQAIKASLNDLVKLGSSYPKLDDKNAEALVDEIVQNENPKPGANREAWVANLFKAGTKSPAHRLFLKILARLDPMEIAKIPKGGRVVFSTNPTRMQRAMPDLAESDIAAFVADRKVLAAAFQRVLPNKEDRERSRLHYSLHMDRQPAQILVALEAYGDTKEISATLNVLDAKGRLVSSADATLGIGYEETLSRQRLFTKLFVEASKKGFELGPIGKEIARRVGPGDVTQIRPLSKPALDAVLSPATIDPLSIATSDTLLKGSELAGIANVVALVPDSVETWARVASEPGKTSLDVFLEGTQSDDDVQVEQTEDWLILMPSSPEAAAESRIPRGPLQEFLRKAYQAQRVSIEDACSLAASLPGRDLREVARATRLFLPTNAMMVLYTPAPILELYGLLTPEQREAAKNGDVTVRIANLPKEAGTAASQVFYMNTFVQFGEAGKPIIADEENNLLLSERTYVVPNGLSASDAVVFRDVVEPAPFVTYALPSGSTYQAVSAPEEMSEYLAPYRRPDLYPGFVPDQTIHGVRMGTERTLHISVRSQEGFETTTQLSESFPGDGVLSPIDKYLDLLTPEQRLDMEKKIAAVVEAKSKLAKSPGEASQPTKPPMLD